MTLAPQSIAVERPARPLEDPTGRRLRWMRRVGRAIALLFLLWLVALVLGALGVAPSPGWLFGGVFRQQAAPASPARTPAPRQSVATDFTRALPVAATPVS